MFQNRIFGSVNWPVVLKWNVVTVWAVLVKMFGCFFHLEMCLMHTSSSLFGSAFCQYHLLYYIKMSEFVENCTDSWCFERCFSFCSPTIEQRRMTNTVGKKKKKTHTILSWNHVTSVTSLFSHCSIGMMGLFIYQQSTSTTSRQPWCSET